MGILFREKVPDVSSFKTLPELSLKLSSSVDWYEYTTAQKTIENLSESILAAIKKEKFISGSDRDKATTHLSKRTVVSFRQSVKEILLLKKLRSVVIRWLRDKMTPIINIFIKNKKAKDAEARNNDEGNQNEMDIDGQNNDEEKQNGVKSDKGTKGTQDQHSLERRYTLFDILWILLDTVMDYSIVLSMVILLLYMMYACAVALYNLFTGSCTPPDVSLWFISQGETSK